MRPNRVAIMHGTRRDVKNGLRHGSKAEIRRVSGVFALPRDERLRDFGTAWLMMRRDRRMPRRRDLDPITFARVLPYVLLSRLE